MGNDIVTVSRNWFDGMRRRVDESRGDVVVAAGVDTTYLKYRQREQREKPMMYMIGVLVNDGDVLIEDQSFLNVGGRHFKITAYRDWKVSEQEMMSGNIPINPKLFNYTFRQSAIRLLPSYMQKAAEEGLASLKKELASLKKGLDSLNSPERAV